MAAHPGILQALAHETFTTPWIWFRKVSQLRLRLSNLLRQQSAQCGTNPHGVSQMEAPSFIPWAWSVTAQKAWTAAGWHLNGEHLSALSVFSKHSFHHPLPQSFFNFIFYQSYTGTLIKKGTSSIRFAKTKSNPQPPCTHPKPISSSLEGPISTCLILLEFTYLYITCL